MVEYNSTLPPPRIADLQWDRRSLFVRSQDCSPYPRYLVGLRSSTQPPIDLVKSIW